MLFLTPLPQRLDTSATPTFAGILAGDGTAAAPSISFASDSDTGFYRASANQIGVSAGGNRSVLFAANGTVQGTYSTGQDSWSLYATSASGGATLAALGNNQNITLTPSGTGSVYVDAAANTKLLIKAGGSDRLELQASGNDGYISGPTGAIIFRTNGSSEAFRAFANQRIGIGTGNTDSGALLQLGGAGTTTAATNGIVFSTDVFGYRSAAGTFKFETTAGTSGLTLTNANSQLIITNNASGAIFNEPNFGIIFRTAGTTALTLDSSQNATFAGTVKPQLATTAGAPAYVKGAIYFDTTLNKLRVGGATAWETITSV